MSQESIIQEESLAEVIDIVKDLIAKIDDKVKLGCAPGVHNSKPPTSQS